MREQSEGMHPLLLHNAAGQQLAANSSQLWKRELAMWWGLGNAWSLKMKPRLQEMEQNRKTGLWLQCICYWIKHCLNHFCIIQICDPRAALLTPIFCLVWFECFFFFSLLFIIQIFITWWWQPSKLWDHSIYFNLLPRTVHSKYQPFV